MWWNYPLTRGKSILCEFSNFDTHSWRTLPCFGHSCALINTYLLNILWFSCQGKSRYIIYQRTCWFLWLIFAQHGLFGILLTVYSSLSRLTDNGIYYITRCGIRLLTIFHIPYIILHVLSTKIEKSYTAKIMPFFFFVQYMLSVDNYCLIYLYMWLENELKINL